jgi:hypothetical protein
MTHRRCVTHSGGADPVGKLDLLSERISSPGFAADGARLTRAGRARAPCRLPAANRGTLDTLS